MDSGVRRNDDSIFTLGANDAGTAALIANSLIDFELGSSNRIVGLDYLLFIKSEILVTFPSFLTME